MRIRQSPDHFENSSALTVRFLNEGQVIAQINFDTVQGIQQLQSEFYFPLERTPLDIEFELVGEGTAYFIIEADAYYGEG